MTRRHHPLEQLVFQLRNLLFMLTLHPWHYRRGLFHFAPSQSLYRRGAVITPLIEDLFTIVRHVFQKVIIMNCLLPVTSPRASSHPGSKTASFTSSALKLAVPIRLILYRSYTT